MPCLLLLSGCSPPFISIAPGVETQSPQIVAGHRSLCPWRRQPTYCQLPIKWRTFHHSTENTIKTHTRQLAALKSHPTTASSDAGSVSPSQIFTLTVIEYLLAGLGSPVCFFSANKTLEESAPRCSLRKTSDAFGHGLSTLCERVLCMYVCALGPKLCCFTSWEQKNGKKRWGLQRRLVQWILWMRPECTLRSDTEEVWGDMWLHSWACKNTVHPQKR